MKAISLIGLAGSLLAAGVALAAPVVHIDAGRIRGISNGATEAFMGVPYARPPLATLRWQPPQPVAHWTGVRDARVSAACYQSPPARFGPFTDEFLIEKSVSEDCLYLNVWKSTRRSTKLPVFVFIHGGGFGSGSGTIPIYDGNDLASRGVVVVTFNYRVGVFGFLAHPDLTRESGQDTSGNYGLLDMIAALKWVRTNIAKFGGDPEDVTVAGQSAGAAAVNDLLVSPLAKGLFHRAVAQSGSGMGIRMTPLAEAEANGAALGERLGAASIAELRRVPADRLQKASESPPPSPGASASPPRIVLAPNLDHVIVDSDPEAATAQLMVNVPLLTGFNTDEGNFFGSIPRSPAEFEEQVRSRYGASANQFLSLYPHSTAAEVSHSYALLGRDRYMASLVLWAQERSRASGQAVYTYFYDHPYPSSHGQSFGAFHTAEVPYVFGALGRGDRIFTDADRAVSRRIQAHWIAFMRSGDPSVPGQAWPQALAAEAKVMGIGDSVGMQYAVSSYERYLAFRDYVRSGGQLSLF